MERCLQQHVPDNDLQQHIPGHWRRKTKIHPIEPKTVQPAGTNFVEGGARVKPTFHNVTEELKSWSSEIGVKSGKFYVHRLFMITVLVKVKSCLTAYVVHC